MIYKMNLKLKYITLVLWALALTTTVSAQEAGLIKGVVMEKGSASRIAAAEIQNKRTQASVSSNDFGLFQIKGIVGDTLVIFKQDFMDAQLVISSEKDVVVYLNKGRSLSEVRIYGQSKKQELNDLKKDYRNKGSFYAGKPPLLSYIFTPLTAIYELFGRTPKNARRFGKYYTSELQQTEIDGFFNETIIQKHTDLRGEDLEKFMLNYRPDYEVAKKWTEYDALKYIMDAYKKFSATLPKK